MSVSLTIVGKLINCSASVGRTLQNSRTSSLAVEELIPNTFETTQNALLVANRYIAMATLLCKTIAL